MFRFYSFRSAYFIIIDRKVEKWGIIELLSVSDNKGLFFLNLNRDLISRGINLIFIVSLEFFKWFFKHNKLSCNMLMPKQFLKTVYSLTQVKFLKRAIRSP